MKSMKFFSLLLLTTSAWAAQLDGVHTVYLMPMAYGLDQYLAGQFTEEHLFQVVTDPKLADAVVTDHLGKGFEQELATYSVDPKAKRDENGRVIISSFGRGRGNVFIVSRQSHQVLWSAYERPRGSSSREVEKNARRFAKKLRDELP